MSVKLYPCRSTRKALCSLSGRNFRRRCYERARLSSLCLPSSVRTLLLQITIMTLTRSTFTSRWVLLTFQRQFLPASVVGRRRKSGQDLCAPSASRWQVRAYRCWVRTSASSGRCRWSSAFGCAGGLGQRLPTCPVRGRGRVGV